MVWFVAHVLVPPAAAAPWEPASAPALEAPTDWSNDVELADLDADGDLDVVVPNGGGYSRAGTPEPTRLLRNDGAGGLVEEALPVPDGLHRAAKARDLTGDGVVDLFLPGAWGTPSVWLVGDGAGGWIDRSDRLPPDALSVSDAEAGDVDGDGDLDLVLSDSGPGDALFSDGGVTRLWRNDGEAGFVDVTDAQMPAVLVGWSWELELADIDLDWDLDLLVSCKTCDGSSLFANDGAGTFTDASAALPQRPNNYDFEALDLTGDGRPDLVTINDGPGLDERILVNTGTGFADETDERLPPSENLGLDDNVLVFLDFEHDGDTDVVIGSLTDPDRVLINDGTGQFVVETALLGGPTTRGTLGLAAGDLDGDGRLDLVMAQGELAWTNRWYRGTDVPVDAQPPVVELGPVVAAGEPVWARVHDRKAPVMPDDAVVTLRWTAADGTPAASTMTHAGHALWRGVVEPGLAGATLSVCALDRAGNEACTAPVPVPGGPTTPTTPTSPTPPADTGHPEPRPGQFDDDGDDAQGCGCASTSASGAGSLLLALLTAAGRRRPRRGAARR